jgi:hypothetical protein
MYWNFVVIVGVIKNQWNKILLLFNKNMRFIKSYQRQEVALNFWSTVGETP